MYGLALLGAVLTIVALYDYLVLGSQMYIDPPDTTEPVVLAVPLFAAILVCAVGVVLMGVYPEPWVKAALQATGRAVLTNVRLQPRRLMFPATAAGCKC